MPPLKTWHATYPLIGAPEALAMVADLGDASFLVAIAATSRTAEQTTRLAPVFHFRGTLSEAQERADAMVAELLGREVAGKWHSPA